MVAVWKEGSPTGDRKAQALGSTETAGENEARKAAPSRLRSTPVCLLVLQFLRSSSPFVCFILNCFGGTYDTCMLCGLKRFDGYTEKSSALEY